MYDMYDYNVKRNTTLLAVMFQQPLAQNIKIRPFAI